MGQLDILVEELGEVVLLMEENLECMAGTHVKSFSATERPIPNKGVRWFIPCYVLNFKLECKFWWQYHI